MKLVVVCCLLTLIVSAVDGDDEYHWQRWSPNTSKMAGGLRFLTNSTVLAGGANRTVFRADYSVCQLSYDGGKTFSVQERCGAGSVFPTTFSRLSDDSILATGMFAYLTKHPVESFWSRSVDGGLSWHDYGSLLFHNEPMKYLMGGMVVRSTTFNSSAAGLERLAVFGWWSNTQIFVSGVAVSDDGGLTNALVTAASIPGGHWVSGSIVRPKNEYTFMVGGSVPDQVLGTATVAASVEQCYRMYSPDVIRCPLTRRLGLARCMQRRAAQHARDDLPVPHNVFRAALRTLPLNGNSSQDNFGHVAYRWQSEPNPTEGGFIFVDTHFFDDQRGFVLQQNWSCCEPGSLPQNVSILASSDGGQTLSPVFVLSSPTVHWRAWQMKFVNDKTGFVIGGSPDSGFYGSGFLVRTDDGGLNWKASFFNDVMLINNFWYCSNDLMYMNCESVFQFANLYRYATHKLNVNDCPFGTSSSN